MKHRRLRATAPVRPAAFYITDIQELQVICIVFQVNHITLGAACIRGTCAIGALHRLQVRQRRVLPGEFIKDNLVGLADALFDIDLGDEPPFRRLARVATGAALESTRLVLNLKTQICAACGAEL